MQRLDEVIKTLVEKTFEFGDIFLVSNKGHGKTNALEILATEFARQETTRTIVFEDFPKLALELGSEFAFVRVSDRDVIESEDNIDLSDVYLSHSRDFTVLRKSYFESALRQNRNLVFVMEIKDTERKAFFIYSIVKAFYDRAYNRLYKGYQKKERIVFILEEAQNAFSQATLNRKVFNRLQSIFAIARNLSLHFILASQRLQDVNARIRARTQLLIGKPSLDDWELKVRRLVRHTKHGEEILDLEKGSFLFTTTDEIIKFSKFVAEGKAKEYTRQPEPEPKRKRTFAELLASLWLRKDVRKIPKAQQSEPEPEDEDETEGEELDEDYELLGKW